MQDRFFIDTNLLIYYVSDNASRKDVVKDLLVDNENIIISSQVITEFVAVTVTKKILSFDDSVKYAKEFLNLFYLELIDNEVILLSFKISEQYKYSIWDSLIMASALESNCSVLYTEDFQHGQIIDKKLKIINPFSEKV
jgi:predicted nucleic acid-binding protein